MKYISTRGAGPAVNFEDALLSGLAPDGGLYMPEHWPLITPDRIRDFKNKSYAHIAFEIMKNFTGDSIPENDLKIMIDETYNEKNFQNSEIAPLHALSPDLQILELFHGPTLAFKDMALQLLGRLFDYVLKKRGQNVTILGATSGDTGSAAIEGCRHSAHVRIFILYPHNRVSDVQRRQMTTVDADNVHVLAVKGTFDDCQAMVKDLFNDAEFRKTMNLSAVNSINWARIMAQIIYYFYASVRAGAPDRAVSFAVPTGNFGNVFAGYGAQKMGLPIALALATNRNDILTRFFENGEMKKQGVSPTMTPSMDIEISSNFERYLFELLNRDAASLKKYMDDFKTTGAFKIDDALLRQADKDFKAFRCSESETAATMREIFEETGYVLDPHSAIALHAASQLLGKKGDAVIALATAHPAKFPDAVKTAIGQTPELPSRLKHLLNGEEHFTILPCERQAIEKYMKSVS